MPSVIFPLLTILLHAYSNLGGGPSDWLVIINMNPEFDRIVGEESGKTLLQADPEQYPAIYAIPDPNESYVYDNKEGKEL